MRYLVPPDWLVNLKFLNIIVIHFLNNTGKYDQGDEAIEQDVHPN